MPATTPATTDHLARWAAAELDAARQRHADDATAMHNHLENLAYYAGQVHAPADLLARPRRP